MFQALWKKADLTVSGQQYSGLGATRQAIHKCYHQSPGRLQVSFLCYNRWLKKWRGDKEMLHKTLSSDKHTTTILQLKGKGHFQCHKIADLAHYWNNKRNGSTRSAPPFWSDVKAVAKFGLHLGATWNPVHKMKNE